MAFAWASLYVVLFFTFACLFVYNGDPHLLWREESTDIVAFRCPLQEPIVYIVKAIFPLPTTASFRSRT